MATIFQRTIFRADQNHSRSISNKPIHMLEGAGSPRVQLAHTDGGDDGQVVGAEQVVLAQSDEVAEPVRLG